VRAVPFAVLAGWVCLKAASAAHAEGALVRDVGIFSDLDEAVRITLPARVDRGQTRLRLDDTHHDVVLYEGDFPLKVYALPRPCPAGLVSALALVAQLGPADAAELRGLVGTETAVEQIVTTENMAGDHDGDGIPDALDILMGARKLVLNHATYKEGYVRLSYPQGDVPRATGVCSDTIVRAYRNAGIDLQSQIAEDIRADPSAYPAVTHPNPSIDHRRVKTLLTWFQRHVTEVHAGPMRRGDVVFLDTFPSRPGPDHVGIISDRTAPSGLPFVINNWTVGYREGEMDLLPSIPVTHRFRMK
jgi:hypothetical protein